MDPTFLIILGIVGAVIYFINKGKKEKEKEYQELQNKIDELERNKKENEDQEAEKIKDYLDEHKFQIRVVPEERDFEGKKFKLLLVQGKGHLLLKEENTRAIFVLHILDQTFEGEEWHVVCSDLNEYTDNKSRIFEMKSEEEILGPDHGSSEWINQFIIPVEAILPPLKGKRDLLFEVYLCDPKTRFNNGVMANEDRGKLNYNFADCNFEFDYPEVGWMDEIDGRDRCHELIMQLAYAVAAADKKIEKSENQIIMDWALAVINLERDEYYEEKRKHMTDSAKKAHDLAVAGELNIQVITEEMLEIAPKYMKYYAIELMLDVCVSDQDIKKVEDEKIEQAVNGLGLDWSEYKVMRDTRIADVEKVEKSEELDEAIFGIKKDMTNVERCTELRMRYDEYRSLSVHNDVKKRKQALDMIERIKNLRKKYKC